MNEEVEITLQQDDVTVETPMVADYILPTATANTLGGVKIGNNINIDTTGHISVPIATDSNVGLVKAGTGLTVSSDGTLTATGTYELPEATKTILGGVYVDDELSTTSTHPVQNAVVSLGLQELDGDITTLNGTVGGLSTTVGNLTTTVGTLNNSVTSLSSTVTSQGNSITTIGGSISSIENSISGINDDITELGNGMAQYQGYVDPLLVSNEEVIESTELDTPADFTGGNLTVYRRGRTGIIDFYLEATLTLASNTPYNLCKVSVDNTPTYESYGILLTDDGEISVTITSAGYIILQNLTATSKTITKITGNLSVVFN